MFMDLKPIPDAVFVQLFLLRMGMSSIVTYMLLLNCALKLVEEIILHYDARSKKPQISVLMFVFVT